MAVMQSDEWDSANRGVAAMCKLHQLACFLAHNAHTRRAVPARPGSEGAFW